MGAAWWSQLSARLLPGLRRSLSEGFLLLEPRSPRFLSDSTIHRLIRPSLDLKPVPRSPSVQTLRKQLTQEGGSLNQMLLLLNGAKVESSVEQSTGLTSDLNRHQCRADQSRLGENSSGPDQASREQRFT